ncbi:MAG: transcription-repair coupling factor, partial [Planctomycetes bacterium]|nr:transcription-repair coupling factor [Planctomycetota bacterium]
DVIAAAIRQELARDGQVYLVHNRIHDIDRVARRIRMLVPEARLEIGHGQMPEGALARVMRRFVAREFDVLVSTTIIESGLDIPNVNTIIIDDADMYGLADLHQLRGRVGRYKHQAYAYLLLPVHREMHPDAEKRLRAIEEFSHLGAGFQIALRDLEIRGAGNILGAEQSGHIATVGYDLYCQLLDRAVRALKGGEAAREPERPEAEIELDLEAYLPEEYVPHGTGRIDLYRRIAKTGAEETIDAIAREIEDRFGPLPAPAAMLIDLQRLRIRFASRGIARLERDGPHILIAGPGIRARPGRYPLRILDDGRAAIRAPEPARTPEDALRIALDWAGGASASLRPRVDAAPGGQ